MRITSSPGGGLPAVLFREGLVRLLEEAGREVVAAVGDADALRRAVAEHAPDLAVVDVRMPPDQDSDGALAAQVDPLANTRTSQSCCSRNTSSCGTACS